jgi:hypothetical protein
MRGVQANGEMFWEDFGRQLEPELSDEKLFNFVGSRHIYKR